MKIIKDYENIDNLEVPKEVVDEIKVVLEALDKHYGKNRKVLKNYPYIVLIENKSELEFLEDKPTNFITSKEIEKIKTIKTENENWLKMYLYINRRHEVFVFLKEKQSLEILKNV